VEIACREHQNLRSSWVDRLLGAVLIFMVAYGVRTRSAECFRGARAFLATTKLLRRRSSVRLPLLPHPQAEDRESPLVWLGWGLLAASVAVQVLIWRVEKADAVGNHHEQVLASHPPRLQQVARGSSWLSETF
jgi:hypothetical protein